MFVHEMIFKVAGVTFDNEQGKNIQKEIKRVLDGYKRSGEIDETEDLYRGYTNKEIKEDDLEVEEYEGINFHVNLVKDTFDNEPCFKIYLVDCDGNNVHIGYMPKKRIAECLKWLDEGLEMKANLNIIGGKFKHVDQVENSNGDYVDKVVTDEDTYGAEITLSFFKNRPAPQIQQPSEEQPKDNKKKIIKGILIYFLIVGIVILIGLLNTYIQEGTLSNIIQ